MFDKLKEKFGFRRERTAGRRIASEVEPLLSINSRQTTSASRTNLVGAIQGPRTIFLASGYRYGHNDTAITHDPNAGPGGRFAAGVVSAGVGSLVLTGLWYGVITTGGILTTLGTGGVGVVLVGGGLLAARSGLRNLTP